jgi:ribosomal protein L36
VKQDSVKVQNVGFVPTNTAEHGTVGEISNKSDKLCKDSDNLVKKNRSLYIISKNNDNLMIKL